MTPDSNNQPLERRAPSQERSVRFNTEDMEWFDKNFPWRGSISQFCQTALAEFREAWGDTPPPASVVQKVVRSLVLLKVQE